MCLRVPVKVLLRNVLVVQVNEPRRWSGKLRVVSHATTMLNRKTADGSGNYTSRNRY